MNNKEVLELIRKFLLRKELINTDTELSDETNFHDHTGTDSLDVVEMALEIEDKFNVYIDDDELNRVQTIGDLVRVSIYAEPLKNTKKETS